jgi:hypothetical protein
MDNASKVGETASLRRTLAQFAPPTADTRKANKQKIADEQPAA